MPNNEEIIQDPIDIDADQKPLLNHENLRQKKSCNVGHAIKKTAYYTSLIGASGIGAYAVFPAAQALGHRIVVGLFKDKVSDKELNIAANTTGWYLGITGLIATAALSLNA